MRAAGKANERAQKLEGDNLKRRNDLEAATAESRAKQAELAKEQSTREGCSANARPGTDRRAQQVR